jgi:hypothetical protein
VSNRLAGIAIAAGLVLAAGCSHDTTSPHSGVYLSVFSGGNQSDTIGATLPSPLVLQVAGTSTVAGQLVLIAVNGPTGASGVKDTVCYAQVTTPGVSVRPGCTYRLTADTTGQVAVAMTLFDKAARVSIVATVVNVNNQPLGSQTTIPLTITPGVATGIATETDTSLYPGAMISVSASVRDRAGNSIPATLSFGPAFGPITFSNPHITANAIGRGGVVVTGDGFTDTAYVSVVPTGTIAFTSQNLAYPGIAIMNLDGSHYHVIDDTVGVVFPSWSPDGARIAFQYSVFPSARIAVIDTTGKQWFADTMTFTQPGEGEFDPIYSRDGQWLYFTNANDATAQIWRVGADSAPTALPNQSPAWDYQPTPSPDGTQLAYVSAFEGEVAATLKILNVSTGAVTNTGALAYRPAWAPTGQSIAFSAAAPYSDVGPLHVIQSDGSNEHVVGPSNGNYYFGIDWSPDAQWIVAVDFRTTHINLINVASGLVLPLGFTQTAYAPIWRPK